MFNAETMRTLIDNHVNAQRDDQARQTRETMGSMADLDTMVRTVRARLAAAGALEQYLLECQESTDWMDLDLWELADR